MIVPVTFEQREYAGKLAQQIRKYKYGEKFKDSYSEHNNYVGFLAEVVICDCFNYPRPEFKPFEADKGFDLIIKSKKVDVKNAAACYSFNVNRQKYEEAKGKVDIFLFVRVLQNEAGLLIEGYQNYEAIRLGRLMKPDDERQAYYSLSAIHLKRASDLLQNNHQPF